MVQPDSFDNKGLAMDREDVMFNLLPHVVSSSDAENFTGCHVCARKDGITLDM